MTQILSGKMNHSFSSLLDTFISGRFQPANAAALGTRTA